MSFAGRPQPDPTRPGQESVWDYPRPPALDSSHEHVEVFLGGALIAATDAPVRVLETSHPPTYYLPRAAFVDGSLRPAPGNSFCEFKGDASYLDLISGDTVAPRVAWFYPEPSPGYETLLDHIALYPGQVDRCTVDGEPVRPQPGEFYGGWITDRVAGPFKGIPGSRFW